MALSKEFSNEIEKAVKVAKKYSAELMKLPGVVVVGVGTKRKRFKLTGEAAVVISVKEKLTKEEMAARGWKPLPEMLDGIPVDVVEYHDPLKTKRVPDKETLKAIKVKESVEKTWLATSNVTAIGVGNRIKDGRLTGEVCIQIFVAEKLSNRDCKKKGYDTIPRKIKGVPVDVIEMKPLKFSGSSGHRADRFDPLEGGISVGTAAGVFSYGTLGGIVFDGSGNQRVLSNEHVLDDDVGEDVVQPGSIGTNGFEFTWQLDPCNPVKFFRLDTPNTVGGSILAGAAAGAAIAAAASDKIDPTREGQENTDPPAAALTHEEYTKINVKYPYYPIPGTPFELDADWKYERRTNMGNFQYADSPHRENEHYVLFHKLLTDKTLYNPDDIIHLVGLVIEDPVKLKKQKKRKDCDRYYCVSHLFPKGVDEDYAVVLRPRNSIILDNPSPIGSNDDNNPQLRIDHQKITATNATTNYGSSNIFDQLDKDEMEIVLKNREYMCLYYGQIPAKDLPLGPWCKWMYIQTINDVAPGTDPLIAAQTIGGLPVSKNMKPTLDIACGPLTFEDDGSFDIEV